MLRFFKEGTAMNTQTREVVINILSNTLEKIDALIKREQEEFNLYCHSDCYSGQSIAMHGERVLLEARDALMENIKKIDSTF